MCLSSLLSFTLFIGLLFRLIHSVLMEFTLKICLNFLMWCQHNIISDSIIFLAWCISSLFYVPLSFQGCTHFHTSSSCSLVIPIYSVTSHSIDTKQLKICPNFLMWLQQNKVIQFFHNFICILPIHSFCFFSSPF